MTFSLFLKKYTIPFIVFVTGACVLVIEIVATRILAPYFGNTIFSISSVLSVVLAALSIGYYAGGRIADQHPSEKLFYSIIALSGACVVILHIIGIGFLSFFGYKLSITWGPLFTSFLLFFFQSLLLGTLSPFAIKIQSLNLEQSGIGSISGDIFFWSTLGSIFGSLLTGFFLIPNLGINTIIFSVGFLLIVLGLWPLIKINFWIKLFLFLITLALYLSFTHNVESIIHSFDLKSMVYSNEALYQKITIYDGVYENKPARFLFQDRNPSAVAFINSNELAAPYTKYYSLYQIFNPDIKQALMIGAGAYSVPKDLLYKKPQTIIDVVEIEPSLLELGKKYFNVPDNPKLTTIVADGRRFLIDSPKKYDLIFSDAYSSIYSTPLHLTTQEFFTLAKSKLTNKGVFIANVIGSLSDKPQSFAMSEIKTFQSVFKNNYFFAVNDLSHSDLQNIIFVGYNGDNIINVNDKVVKNNSDPIISNLAQKKIDLSKFDFSSHSILTDNFAPVEYLISKEL